MLIISHENIFQLFAFLDLREDKPIRTDSGVVFAEPGRACLQYLVKEKSVSGEDPTIPLRCLNQYYLKCISILITESNQDHTWVVVRYLYMKC